MADSFDLGVAFLGAHPGEAARVLETLSTRDAAALFEAIPANLGAGVLAAMLPTAAARILNDLPEAVSVSIAAGCSTQSIVAILRHVDTALRARLLAGLPATAAVAARMLLGFPDDTVGAWTDTAIVAVPSASNVGTVLEQVREAADTDLEQVFVVDPEQHLLGGIGLHALLRADARALASGLTRPVAATLSAMMPMASARAMNLWERTQALPVLDRDRRLIGVLRRSALTRAMRARARGTADVGGAGSVTGALASSYWGIVSGLSSATLALLPPIKRVLPEDG